MPAKKPPNEPGDPHRPSKAIIEAVSAVITSSFVAAAWVAVTTERALTLAERGVVALEKLAEVVGKDENDYPAVRVTADTVVVRDATGRVR